MNDAMMKEARDAMTGQAGGQMMVAAHEASNPMLKGAVMTATGYTASRALLGGVARNPWVMLALGAVAGYLIHKHQKEILLAVSNATGMGKDLLLQQKETLADMIEEAHETQEQQAKAEAEK